MSIQTPKLILIRGLPGSGKSTLAKNMARTLGYQHYEADMYFTDSAGNYVFDREAVPAAHIWCMHKVDIALLSNQSVIVSNTFVRKWEMEPYIHMAKVAGAELIILEAKGDWENVHNVPQETIERMRKNWENL